MAGLIFLWQQPVVIPEETDNGSRWAGEWLPLPVLKHPAPIPKRSVKLHARCPNPRGKTSASVLNPSHIRAALVVHDCPVSEIVCRVDMTQVHDEESIIAALAALL